MQQAEDSTGFVKLSAFQQAVKDWKIQSQINKCKGICWV